MSYYRLPQVTFWSSTLLCCNLLKLKPKEIHSFPDFLGGKVLFTKGAESAILPFTTSGEIEKTRLHVDEFALVRVLNYFILKHLLNQIDTQQMSKSSYCVSLNLGASLLVDVLIH